ncbi:MAG: TIGR03905 family TSCPD domain-containing protein [Lentisphaeria bacterium]|nr:TIGR03905 family TSCPD domain-containing protein [Lentisphaeria bacterium]
MTYRFQTSEMVCSRMIEIEIDEQDGRVKRVEFTGGCPGNLSGIGRLAAGMKPEELIGRLQGIRCGGKPTSCPDQLANALKEIARRKQA